MRAAVLVRRIRSAKENMLFAEMSGFQHESTRLLAERYRECVSLRPSSARMERV